MINYNIIPQVIREMENVKMLLACSKHNVIIQTTAEFASN